MTTTDDETAAPITDEALAELDRVFEYMMGEGGMQEPPFFRWAHDSADAYPALRLRLDQLRAIDAAARCLYEEWGDAYQPKEAVLESELGTCAEDHGDRHRWTPHCSYWTPDQVAEAADPGDPLWIALREALEANP